jgi:hypothetical protein
LAIEKYTQFPHTAVGDGHESGAILWLVGQGPRSHYLQFIRRAAEQGSLNRNQVVAPFFITHDGLKVWILVVSIIRDSSRVERGPADQTWNTASALLVSTLPLST